LDQLRASKFRLNEFSSLEVSLIDGEAGGEGCDEYLEYDAVRCEDDAKEMLTCQQLGGWLLIL